MLGHSGRNTRARAEQFQVPMPTPQPPRFRREFSAPGLVNLMRQCFGRIEDPVKARRASLADNLMAALAIIGLFSKF